LVIVTVCAALGVPTAKVVLNAIDVGETVTGAMAVPCTSTVVEPRLSATVIVPVCRPLAVLEGVNVALIVHVLPAATLGPQVSVSPNSALGVIVRVCGSVLSFVTVKVFAALVWPRATEPRAREEGVTAIGATPVPCTATDIVPETLPRVYPTPMVPV
jgi:hypothetical protein